MKDKMLRFLLFLLLGLIIIFCVVTIIAQVVIAIQYANVPVSELPGWVWWILR